MTLTEELNELIDSFLAPTNGRNMYGAQEVQDFALDLRLIVAKHDNTKEMVSV